MLGGRYRVLGRIGSGGMAEVFRAEDEVLHRPVAVKVFRAENVAHDDAHGIERQQLEVAALARLNHPNLITLYDGSIEGAVNADGSRTPAYIVMELIEGPSLAAQIQQGPLPEASVREIGIQLAEGLSYVHAQGMVHRDVKPENILLGIDRSDDDHTVRARLSDFGIVRLLGTERLTSVNFTLGTASYLAPEQARGSAVDPPADVYSLGLVLLEALTGRRMFDGPPLEAAMARLSQRPQVPAGLPEPWPGLLYAMTEFDPAMRPSAKDVARALRNEGSRALPLVPLAVPVAAGMADAPTGMIGALPSSALASAPLQSGAIPRRRRRPSAMALTAAASVLVILTTLAVFLFTGNDAKSPAQPPAGSPSAAAHSTTPSHHRSASQSKAPSSGASGHSSAATSASSRTAPAGTTSAPQHSVAPPPGHPSHPTHSNRPTSTVPTAPPTSAPVTSAPPSSAAASSAGATGSTAPAGGASTTG